MREKVLRYIGERKLMRAGDRVSVAVSAGADSVALLRVLLDLRAELGIVLSVAHFNHGLRGEASEADEAFVAELARHHDLEFFSGRDNVRDHALAAKLSVEAAARELRYQWFALLAAQNKLNAIATGHTLDDQAETVLLKFLRGAGTRGLAGIFPEITIGGKEASEGRRTRVSSAEADSFSKTNGIDAALKARTTRTALSPATSEAPDIFQPQQRLTQGPVSRHRVALPGCQEADRNQPQMGRKSLAQHGAVGGVLGKRDGGPESRRDDRGYDTGPEATDQSTERGANASCYQAGASRLPGVHVVRPLLDVTRNEVEQYLTAIGQAWREDESNLDRRFSRNRVRHELLPLLEREYNPSLRQVLSDAAELSRAEEEYWQALVQRELEARQTGVGTATPSRESLGETSWSGRTLERSQIEVPQGRNSPSPGRKSWVEREKFASPFRDDTVFPSSGDAASLPDAPSPRMSLDNFAQLPLALQRRLLKRLLESRQIAADFEHIQKLLRCALGESSKAELPGGWMASRIGEHLELYPPQPAHSAVDYAYTLPVPGEVRIPELGLIVRCLPMPHEFAKEEPPGSLLSAELLGRELIVRNWRAGDRFWPAQSKSEEKLKRLFSERHIPAGERPSWPVVLSSEQLVWVRGFPVARAFAWNGSGDAVKIELLC